MASAPRIGPDEAPRRQERLGRRRGEQAVSLGVGGAALAPIVEIPRLAFPAALFFGEHNLAAVRAEAGWLAPTCFEPEGDQLLLSHHSWLVHLEGKTVLIDPCVGNHKRRPAMPAYDRLDTPWLQRLAEAGARPEDVDVVFCTHLHVDHCGWNTRLADGRWVPTFPNAAYLFSKAEHDFWAAADCASGANRSLEVNLGVFEDSVRPVMEAGQARLLSGATRIADALEILPAPGHTPGHMMALLSDGGAPGLLFAGDALHHPVQIVHPDWNTRACADPDQAVRTRTGLLALCADGGHRLAAAHFMPPHALSIRREGDGFRPAHVD